MNIVMNVEDYKEELPFCPKYTTGYSCGDLLRVTWFEMRFSQSYYHSKASKRRIGSNACTLITLLVASTVNAEKLQLTIPSKSLNTRLIHILAVSMLRGNKIHDDLRERKLLPNLNLTIPEAIQYTVGHVKNLKEWKCKLYGEPLSLSLYENIKNAWLEWINYKKKDLYVVIVADSRSVLLIMQRKRDTVYLVDSHQHSSLRGAVICAAQRNKLKTLCCWYQELLNACYKSRPTLYELSFLYFDEN